MSFYLTKINHHQFISYCPWFVHVENETVGPQIMPRGGQGFIHEMVISLTFVWVWEMEDGVIVCL